MESPGRSGVQGQSEEEAMAAMDVASDVVLLKKVWRNEKAAPEILHFEAGLVQRAREQIQLLEETVEELTEIRSDDIVVSLYQMDLDRALFLLRSYLRIRLQKVIGAPFSSLKAPFD
ncbi:hypothetical protein HPP92_013158 [Vanilla planifolia]|uniref:Uncharacterized protein n=1 Tax=Vanilla planifolia TaxID=51239 RepID=A0A835QY54_VANPL|nr:hypothetical protein HPP92_013158 [Vanilla planifolia]